jgi:hypothetical protein
MYGMYRGNHITVVKYSFTLSSQLFWNEMKHIAFPPPQVTGVKNLLVKKGTHVFQPQAGQRPQASMSSNTLHFLMGKPQKIIQVSMSS